MKFSPEQQEIIRHRKGSLLVSAAAGSGKTTTLIAHILDRLCDEKAPGDLMRLIVVTYTKAAAAEMRQRLTDALDALLREQKDTESRLAQHLARQSMLIHQAKICTVDSLCSWFVRNYFQRLDLTPDIRIADTAELLLLQNEVLDELLENEFLEKREDFFALLNAYGSEKNVSELRKHLLKLYDSSQNAPFPEEWLRHCLPAFPETKEELEESDWAKQLLEEAGDLISAALVELELTRRELPPDDPACENLLKADRVKLEALRRMKLGELKQALEEDTPFISANRKEFPKEQKDLLKILRGSANAKTGYLRYFGECRRKLMGKRSMEEELRLLRLTKLPAEAMLRLVLLFSEMMIQRCRDKNIASFMDMEHYTLSLLLTRNEDGSEERTDLARDLSQQFDEIIIDEYQDINQVQECILKALSREEDGAPNMFMVGDIKQSIYRFRRAKPDIFAGKYRSFSEEEEADHRKIDLKANYRSRLGVVDSVNAVFSRLMTDSLGGLPYDRKAALVQKADYPGPGPKTELMLCESPGNAEELFRAESLMIAQKITALMQSGETLWDPKECKEKELHFRDIVILMHSVDKAYEMVKILESFGIPAVSINKTGFYNTLEVQTMLSVLSVIDNPMQDLPLAAVLLSPLGGFSEEELARIRILSRDDPAENLYGSLKKAAQNDEKTAGFLQKLAEWRSWAGILTLSELIAAILRNSGYELYLAAMPSGQVRLANLRMLTEQARQYEETSFRSLYQFNRYIEKKKELKIEEGEASLLSESADLVRIGTIHSSKGLEYPVVFLAALGKSFNDKDIQTDMLCDDRLGLALKTRDPENHMHTENLWSVYVKDRIRADSRSEILRLLYVAMTRAKERLILTAAVNDPGEELDRWKSAALCPEGALPFSLTSRASCHLDWLLMCLAAGPVPALQLTVCAPEEVPLPITVRKSAGKEEIDPALIRSILDFRYPYESVSTAKTAYSVSELKKSEGAEETVPAEFKSLRAKDSADLTPAERGTVYHKLMEHLPMAPKPDYETVRNVIRNLTEKKVFTEREAAVIRSEEISRFFEGEIGERISSAASLGRLHREQPFVLGLPQRRIVPESNSDELVLVQGIIDLYFEEEDGLVLIDYKTDRVFQEEVLIERYQSQLAYYRQALEAAAGKNVKKSYLYSFAMGRFISVIF